MNIQSNSPAHGEDVSKEESSTNAENNQEDSAADTDQTANDQDSTKAHEASETESSADESDTAGQETNKCTTPAVQPVPEEQRKFQEEIIQKEALATSKMELKSWMTTWKTLTRKQLHLWMTGRNLPHRLLEEKSQPPHPRRAMTTSST